MVPKIFKYVPVTSNELFQEFPLITHGIELWQPKLKKPQGEKNHR
jgi:hypothetical protein